MLENPIKAMALEISKSKTLASIFPNLVLDCSVVERLTELKAHGLVLDTELSFKSQIRSIAVTSSSKLGFMRKALSVFGDRVLASVVFGATCFMC